MLKDKVIIVTGGLGLIGKSFCQAIEKNGGEAMSVAVRIPRAAAKKDEALFC